jgi:hypothetical protein
MMETTPPEFICVEKELNPNLFTVLRDPTSSRDLDTSS